MSFWTLSNNELAKGDEASSHVASFKVIPDGTCAVAMIKEFVNDKDKQGNPFLKAVYKLADGEFKNREVIHKIKCFDSKASIADRSINMLKRIYDLTGQKPTHNDAPKDSDLLVFKGKILGVKIAEWNMVNNDGTMSEGNYISEVHPAAGFECVTGVNSEVVGRPSHLETAFSRNAVSGLPNDSSDIPF